MKFGISSAFLNTREIIEIAKAADDLDYDDGIGIPYHVVNLETLNTPPRISTPKSPPGSGLSAPVTFPLCAVLIQPPKPLVPGVRASGVRNRSRLIIKRDSPL
ncbi:hypothetical protein JK2ML_0927 [Mycobacterium leprae Kyoto-2]|uniref:Uncharacterized protein n=2 Tax=Mycobacterium leprae TaxID=1769 RepID=Q9CCD6_MYCLE|nr:hypothetical protein A8144_14075 [Mycobacterium leprae 3125609]OAX70080.1 hypothetical protein A3216_14140 [Mycobacterium leprae 7935681]BBC16872.1 hypothetical protein JK2ML_0927 [Mycobacterium leprae Kyoto-2]CAC31308.1 hypothetical protein [Mycobacterium leprae]CAR71022.1 hypothetical protein MLBr00927 [Mycobacterium leprae Br4923]